MKKILLSLSSFTALTMASNSFISTTINTDLLINNNFRNNKSNEMQSLLVNNKYNYLNSSDWITNQSTIDHKFYSYNTKDADYLLSDGKTSARAAFLVNDQGQLTYNSSFIINIADKTNLDNTKQEMIDGKQVSQIKDAYNPYSKSLYSENYFLGDNSNWQYLQQGGVENAINISMQQGGNKVENSNKLTEDLGLYYIAKATKNNKIDKAIAYKLAQYFIRKSSLKGQLSDKLTNTIIDLITNNNNIYNFIYDMPMTVNNKNYSINYIFDSNNNLIKIYYNVWSKEFNQTLNYHNKVEYKDRQSHSFSSGMKLLLNWKQYANSWTDFTKIYQTISFDASSYIKASGDGWNFVDISANDLVINTKNLVLGSLYSIGQAITSPALPFAPTENIGGIFLTFMLTDQVLIWFFSAQYNGNQCQSLWDMTYDVNLKVATINSIMA